MSAVPALARQDPVLGERRRVGAGAKAVDQAGGTSPKFDYEIVDRVRVPQEPGEYLLSWRWDTEQKSQVWSACGDIVIE